MRRQRLKKKNVLWFMPEELKDGWTQLYNHPKFEPYKEPRSYFAFKKIRELRIDIKTGLPLDKIFD